MKQRFTQHPSYIVIKRRFCKVQKQIKKDSTRSVIVLQRMRIAVTNVAQTLLFSIQHISALPFILQIFKGNFIKRSSIWLSQHLNHLTDVVYASMYPFMKKQFIIIYSLSKDKCREKKKLNSTSSVAVSFKSMWNVTLFMLPAALYLDLFSLSNIVFLAVYHIFHAMLRELNKEVPNLSLLEHIKMHLRIEEVPKSLWNA